MRGRSLMMAVAAAAWLLIPVPQARADWPLSFAHITCSPELGIFRLDALHGNEPTNGDARRIGAYTARQLEGEAIICELPQYRVVVEGRERITGRGPCGAVRGQQVRVSVNGRVVSHRFDERDAEGGWLEISVCETGPYSVELHTDAMTGGWAWVAFCREGLESAHGETSVAKRCMSWRTSEDGFPFGR